MRGQQDRLAGSLTESILAGWIGGARALSNRVGELDLPPWPPGVVPPTPPVVPPGLPAPDPEDEPPVELPGLEAAVRQLLDKRLLSPEQYYALSTAARNSWATSPNAQFLSYVS